MKKKKYPNLAAEMAKHGDTQAKIGKLLGITHPAISRRLSGEVDWSISEIEKICELYGKDFYELFKKDNN